ncbi:MAG: enoyl-CoA hydratase/isomerase family protein [Saprospiraceae bacterium]
MSTIHKSIPAPHIVLLEIENPPANSLSKIIKKRFIELLDELEEDKSIRALILTGKGNKFCVGDDLKEAIKNTELPLEVITKNLQKFGNIMDRVEALPFPVIAAINGWCIGGGLELALCCDIRLAVDSAQFICAGVNVGLTASGYRLPRIIGIGRAKQMLYTGTALPVQKAEQYGLVTGVYTEKKLLPAALEMAKIIATKAPLSVQATKRIVNTAYETAYEDSQRIQEKELLTLAASEDYKNALRAFSAKQKPDFVGR